ncbi:hypothetical protein G6514_001544 [Epicoccum nigrum]|nr:hypothetical protein G6514_001544 [Epicoccum nigrum]
MIQLDDIRDAIQVPCSEKNFISGRVVRTRYFGETDKEYAKRRQETNEKALQRDDQQKSQKIEWEVREDDGMLGRYMFTLDLFIDVNKWANKGGRRSEPPDIGPWNPKTEYYHLDKRLEDIAESLPEELRLNPINTENHIYGPPSVASRTYFMIHAVLMLCKTYLAPEYLPTFGYRVAKPQGPLDPPLVTEPLPVDQPDYWVEKAEDCFEYVRDYVSVLQSFKDRDLVVESPFMAHAIWRAAWAAMYCHWVPKMDPSNALSSKIDPSAWDITNQVLESMAKKFAQTDRYTKQLAGHSNFYKERWKSWTSNGGSPQSSIDANELHEYRTILETSHKQYGSLDADEAYPKQPHNTPYSKLSRLEQENVPEEPHSPVMVVKTDGDEPRRSISTAPSTSSGFTVVNPSSAVAPPHRETVNGHAAGASITRTSHEAPPPRPQQQQTSTYSEQAPQYGQAPAYTYANGASAFTQPISQYAATSVSYAPGSRPQILAEMDAEGNRSINTADSRWFENNESDFLQGQNYFSASYYPFNNHMQSQMPYHMQDHQGSYDTYPTHWPGSG